MRILRWAAVLSHEFAVLQQAAEYQTESVIDYYGATNPAEFFAVLSELFFERPDALTAMYPAVYRQLAAFYRQDPLKRMQA